MNPSASKNSERWIDPDDAPEITAADLKGDVWSFNRKIDSRAEKGALPNNHGESPFSDLKSKGKVDEPDPRH